MELREYYKILKSNMSVVIYTAIIAIIIAYAWSVKQSQTYSASILLNIGQTETQSTADYRYDQFYRLQADDKFAETVVEWLKTPGIAKNIFDKAGVSSDQKTMRSLSKSFQAEKLSSNIVGIRYSTQNNDEAEHIAPAVSSIISEKTKSLNADARDPNWFQINASDLIILKNTQDLRINLGIAALVGLFFGILLAFGKHYISEE
ncbi:MAG: Wzz/FepE/Etk N-terminal domain-containing protein [Candidatus Moranbacteria bacterium]|nr:Wzz/FepE/Etk N-terminal domain-containing protein [Candidatus Moranbacteria bacterium]